MNYKVIGTVHKKLLNLCASSRYFALIINWDWKISYSNHRKTIVRVTV